MLKKLVHIGLFCCALFATAAGIRDVDAMPFFGWTRPKPAHFLARTQDYDTIIIGSSRMHFGLKPNVFDERMGALGASSSTFNIAYTGMRSHDYEVLAEFLLDQNPSRLRRVIYELSDWDPGELGDNWMTKLQVQSHEWRQFFYRMESIWDCNREWSDLFLKAGSATAHTAANFFRVGQAPRIIDDVVHHAHGKALSGSELPWPTGWRNVAINPWPGNLRAHEALLAAPQSRLKNLKTKRDQGIPTNLMGGFNLDAWRHIDRRIRSSGAEPIYVVMPTLSPPFRGSDALDIVARESFLIDLDNPTTHPSLFALENFYDPAHLNTDGATLVSRYIADIVAKHEQDTETSSAKTPR
jgi:hypothetical protein